MACNVFLVTYLFIFSFSVYCFSVSKAQQVPAVYVFGDSLVDVGTNNYLKVSFAKADFPHNGVDFPGKKPTGRFSNGKNAADFLAEKLGLPSAPPYLSLSSKSNKSNAFLAGVSFASGGAGIFNGTDEQYHQSIPLLQQVDQYSRVYEELVQQLGSDGANQHLSKSIFALVIGSNDILGNFGSGSNNNKKSTPEEFVDLMVVTLKGQLKRIYNQGGRKFVLVGIGAVGCIPVQRSKNKTQECNEEANNWSRMYNEGLKSMLKELKSEFKDINYTYFDTYSIFLNFIQKPAAYGFTEVKAACCGLGNLNAKVACLPISTYCSNRSDHLFWDLYHPTQAAAGILADYLYNGPQQYAFPINVKQLAAL